MRVIIGIDPGMSGGIAVIDEDGKAIDVSKMPETKQDIYDYLKEYASTDINECTSVCYLEDVGHGLPGQSSKATATFARHCGHLEMALLALRIPTHTVTPQKWMKSYQLGKSSQYEKREWKNKLKEKAQQIFPKIKVTLCNADALLIAEYGRKQEK
jgi:crossover junction endodeoxyribonuclease RuvC